jgi:hypothetical protein
MEFWEWVEENTVDGPGFFGYFPLPVKCYNTDGKSCKLTTMPSNQRSQAMAMPKAAKKVTSKVKRFLLHAWRQKVAEKQLLAKSLAKMASKLPIRADRVGPQRQPKSAGPDQAQEAAKPRSQQTRLAYKKGA